MVLREDQAHGGGEEAAAGAERARGIPHQGLRVQEERLLPLRPGRRHRQALPHQVRRGWQCCAEYRTHANLVEDMFRQFFFEIGPDFRNFTFLAWTAIFFSNKFEI